MEYKSVSTHLLLERGNGLHRLRYRPLIWVSLVLLALCLWCVASFSVTGSTRQNFLNTVASCCGVLFTLLAIRYALPFIPTKRERIGWIAFGVAVVLAVLGDVLMLLAFYTAGSQHAFPSWGDVCFLLAYVPLWAGLLLQPSLQTRNIYGRLVLLLELLISISGLLTLFWGLSWGPTILKAVEMGALAKALSVCYPILDGTTLICVTILLFGIYHHALRPVRLVLAVAALFLTLYSGVFSYAIYRHLLSVGWLEILLASPQDYAGYRCAHCG